jgi:hypothetical protein
MTASEQGLQCPECGGRNLLVIRGGGIGCVCGARGTKAYFTVAEAPTEGRKEHVISRTFDVARDRPGGQHVASVNSAMMLLTQAASEQDLELDWGTLRLITSADGAVITYLAVIKAYEKPPAIEFPVGGVTILTADGPKVLPFTAISHQTITTA